MPHVLSIIQGGPPIFKTMDGSPTDIASKSTNPPESLKDGNKKISFLTSPHKFFP